MLVLWRQLSGVVVPGIHNSTYSWDFLILFRLNFVALPSPIEIELMDGSSLKT